MAYRILKAETGEILYKDLSYMDTEAFRELHADEIQHFIIEDDPEGDE
jgi:hypothetical protein